MLHQEHIAIMASTMPDAAFFIILAKLRAASCGLCTDRLDSLDELAIIVALAIAMAIWAAATGLAGWVTVHVQPSRE
jgi:hypothetical protein